MITSVVFQLTNRHNILLVRRESYDKYMKYFQDKKNPS